MIRGITLVLFLAFIISACGGAVPTETEAPTPTEPPSLQSVVPSTTTPSATSTSTSTSVSSPTQILSTPTETPLPTLELPTEPVIAPVRMVWDGMPTYLGDSRPGYFFRVRYDPDLWAVTTDQFGFPALAHRDIPACVITPTAGHGLPTNMTVEHDILYTDNVTFDVSTALENGVRKFVTYTGGDGTIITGFEVDFEEQVDECLADAVTVLSTLRSVPASQATPEP